MLITEELKYKMADKFEGDIPYGIMTTPRPKGLPTGKSAAAERGFRARSN